MVKVKLYEKKLAGSKPAQRSLFLDYYPPIRHPITGKETRREFLKLYVLEKPKTEIERELNKEARIKAEDTRAVRQLAVIQGDFSFLAGYDRSDFFAFCRVVTQQVASDTTESNAYAYKATIGHLEKYVGGSVPKAQDINAEFCRGFRKFLLNNAGLIQNSASGYFSRFRYFVNEARIEKIIKSDPFERIDMIPIIEPRREFLTVDELQKLAATPFPEYPLLRLAALFSALTGLRFGDVNNLKWDDVFHDPDHGYFLRLRQGKTSDEITLPITDEARELIGKMPEDSNGKRVFEGLRYNQTQYLQFWIKAAGIKRRIVFHSFRHTNATSLISAGVDIYVVSKLLGHRSIRATQIYARVIDEKKRAAVGKISLK